MKRKSVPGSWHIKSGDQGLATAIFSRFGGSPDLDGDVTMPGAFTDGAKAILSPWNHSSLTHAQAPAGLATVRVKADRAEAEVQFFMDTAVGRDAFTMVKRLAEAGLGQWSYGYDIVKARPGKWDGRPIQILERLDVHEVSPVARGAGRDTRTVSTSSVSREVLTAARRNIEPLEEQRAIEREFLRFVASSN